MKETVPANPWQVSRPASKGLRIEQAQDVLLALRAALGTPTPICSTSAVAELVSAVRGYVLTERVYARLGWLAREGDVVRLSDTEVAAAKANGWLCPCGDGRGRAPAYWRLGVASPTGARS